MAIKDLFIRQLQTEKSMSGAKTGRYSFLVNDASSKEVIKKELERFFKINIVKINSLNNSPKKRKLQKYRKTITGPSIKKVVITLKKGQTIQLQSEKKEGKVEKK